MTRALVTGATGFIGYHVVKQLSESGFDVTCLVRRSSKTEQLQAWQPRLCYGDVRDADAVARAVSGQDLVIHLAGLSKSFSSREMYDVNSDATANVVRGCRKPDTPPTIILVSSLAAAGPATADYARVEQDPSQPVSTYGKSKLRGEQLAIEHCLNRVPLSIIRPPIVFGEGDQNCYQWFYTIAKWGWHLVPTLRDYRVSLIHVEDLAVVMQELALNGQRVQSNSGFPGTYFVADEQQPTHAELGQLIGQALGRPRVRVLHSATPLVKFMGAANQSLGWLRRRPQIFSLDKAREAVAGSWTCSSAALEEDIRFRPLQTLQSRLRQTAEWYADQGWLKIRDAASRPAFSWTGKKAH